MRLPVAVLCLVLAACGADTARTQPSDEELRLIAYLTHDGYVVVERSERDSEGHLLVVTRQGNVRQRYLLAPDDPARPELRLRRLEDECTLTTVPNPGRGITPLPR